MEFPVLVVVTVLAQTDVPAQTSDVRPVEPSHSSGEAIRSNSEPLTGVGKMRYVDEHILGARSKRNWGIGLTIAGGLVIVAGGAMVPTAYAMRTEYARTNGDTLFAAYWAVGAGLVGLGTLVTALGIVFWASGGAELTYYNIQKDKLILGVGPVPGGGGAVRVEARF